MTGTKTSTSDFTFKIVPSTNPFTVPVGMYVISGCPAGGSYAGYGFRALTNGGETFATEYGTGNEFAEASGEISRVEIRFGSAAGAYDLTFRPMICAKALYAVSGRYVPYAPSNRALYEMLRSQQHMNQ